MPKGDQRRTDTSAEGEPWSLLMQRAQAGDRDAYRRLLTEITPYVRALAARHHRQREDIEDSTQWLALAGCILALLAIGHGIRGDITERLHQPVFVLGMTASMATGVLAAVATFLISLPDRSRFWGLLPVPALIVWISTISYGCLTDWVSLQPDGLRMGEAVRCFATLLLTSLPLSLAMLVMVRHAAPLRPTAVTMVGALAVAAISSTALSLFHDLDATIMVLVWNLGAAAVIVTLGGALSGRMLSWVAPPLGQGFNG